MTSPPDQWEVVAPHFKRRHTGVTTTVVQLVPVLSKNVRIAVLGPGLPESFPRLRWRALPTLLRKPTSRPFRIWHARRNNEMLLGIVLRDLFRAPLRLVFTSSAQRRHSAFPRWLIRRMDAVIACSQGAAKFLDKTWPIVPHGIELDRFTADRSDNDSLVAAGIPGLHGVGCFGRVRHSKGTDLFVEAMIRLLPDHPDWTALIVGRVTRRHRSFYRSLQAKIDAAGLKDRIVFVGEVSDSAAWYRKLDLVVAPSRIEGFGLTPMEAMASGVAVVASDAGAYPDMIDRGVTGEIFLVGDGTALTREVRKYMEDDALAERHGKAARHSAMEKFPVAREAEGILAVYEELWQSG